MAFRAYSEKYLAEFVYGATDGTVTTFAVVSGVVGAQLSPAIVFILGISNVLADGFSMASSNYLAEKSDQQLARVPTEGEKAPLKTAAITFVSFIAVGMVPLLPFIAATTLKLSPETQFLYSVIFTACAFITIGAIRGVVTRKNKFLTAFETLFIGAIAAGVAYVVGYFLRGLTVV
ncbi:MAG: VIT1/CCC1 transporter family protein [Patescibacteria group bacterium]|nr:VIT1/CCC1 transporter family protein [Patescibacteria group bacterium]